jgi:hypothetical protein
MINISHAFDSSVEGRFYTKDQLTQLCKHVATRRQQHLCATGDTDHTPLHCRQGCGRTVVGVAQLQCFFEVWIQASLTGRLYQYCKTRLRMGAYAIFTRMRQLDTGSDQLAVPQVIKHGCQSHTIQGPEPWKLCYVEPSNDLLLFRLPVFDAKRPDCVHLLGSSWSTTDSLVGTVSR